jgi:DNA (cytosine-5)-methyltransferase 1
MTTPVRPKSSSPRRRFTFIDLFCGAGGFSEGFLLGGDASQGYELIAASDINPTVEKTYEHRFGTQLGIPHDFIRIDIRDGEFLTRLVSSAKERLAGRELDVLCGGPPCQGYSVFGLRNQDDPRNDLFLHYLRTIEVLNPRYFVIENVPGIARMYGGKTIERIYSGVANLHGTDYSLVGPLFVNAADYGVPQARERVLFIGSRSDCPKVEAISPRLLAKRHTTVDEAIGDLAFLKPWQKADTYPPSDAAALSDYQLQSRRGRLFEHRGVVRSDWGLTNHEAARHTPEVIARFAMMDAGRGLDSIPESLWTQHLSTAKKWCVRLSNNRPSNTIMTLPDDLVHPSQPRILTVREAARIQSFDDTFEFLGPRATGGGGVGNRKRSVEVPQYTQVGNAVPPLLARAVADTVLEALASSSEVRAVRVRA